MASVPKPIGREEIYYNYLINKTGSLPKPIGRKEQYLYYLCTEGFAGAIKPEQVEQIKANADAITDLQDNAVMLNDIPSYADTLALLNE